MTRYLFTTLPSNDLGLLTRSLPIARELRRRGHTALFSSLALSAASTGKEAIPTLRVISPEKRRSTARPNVAL